MARRAAPERPAELKLSHVVEELQLEVGFASENEAYALLERLSSLNRERLLPAIEQVLDEFDRPGEIIRIDRLDVALGRFAAGELDRIEPRLREALREALARAIDSSAVSRRADAATPSGPDFDALPPGAAPLLDTLEHYLLHGSWPYGAAVDQGASPPALLHRLLDDAPAAAADMLRRHAGSERLVKRLAWQMPEHLLQRLLGVLEPDQAAWILPYMRDTMAAHTIRPLVDEAPAAFARRLWTIIVADSLQRSGLHANRLAFLRSLITRLAEGAGATYRSLLESLRLTLGRVPRAGRRPGSLLRTLDELAGEEPEQEVRLPSFQAFAALVEGRPAGTRWLDSAEILQPMDEARALAARGAAAYPSETASLLQRVRRDGGAQADAALRLLLGAAGLPATHATTAQFTAPPALAALALALAEEAPVDLAQTLEAALAEDLMGARALLRRWARSDPEWFASGAGAGRDAGARLLLGSGLAAILASLVPLIGISAAERAALARLFSSLPVSATPEAAVCRTVKLLAGMRRSEPRRLAEALLPHAAGDPELARLLEIAGGLTDTLRTAEAMRCETIDRIRDALLTGTALGRPLLDRLGALALVPGGALRERLRGPVQSEHVAAAFAASGEPEPVRFALLIARGDAALGARVRRVLAQAGERGSHAVAFIAEVLGSSDRSPITELFLGPDRMPGKNQATAFSMLQGSADRLLLALPEAERRLAEQLADTLSRAAAAGDVPRGLLAEGFAVAAAARGRSGDGADGELGALWLAELARRLSASGRRKLLRSLHGKWPGAHRSARALLTPLEEPHSPPGAEPSRPEPGSLAWLMALLGEGGPRSSRRLKAVLRSAQQRARLCRVLPERLLLRIAALLAPPDAAPLLRAAEAVAAAMERCGIAVTREDLWQAVLTGAGSQSPISAVVRALLDRTAAGAKGRKGGAAGLVARVEAEAAALAWARGDHALSAALEERAHERRRAVPPLRTKSAATPERKPGEAAATEPPALRLAVRNAGLVLAASFLPQLFERLGFRDATGQLLEGEIPGRAVHLLQYLADGRCDAPEPLLSLNKLLCGLDRGQPILAEIEPTRKELATCDALLDALLANWPQMKGSSVAALRETFFAREGVMTRRAEGWRVEVERKTLDVLLEGLPWSFSIIMHGWMTEPVFVEW